MDPWLPWPALLTLMIAFCAAPLLIYHRSGKLEDPRWIAALVGLRVVAVLILLLLLARPVATRVQREVEKSQLALLVDQSRSMRTADLQNGVRRDEGVSRFFAANRALIDELREKFELELLAFGGDLLEGSPTFQGTEDATGIGPALERFWRAKRQGRLTAVVVFSDGNHNHGPAPLDAARDYAHGRVPIHGVLVGSERPTRAMRDLGLVDLVAPAAVDLGNTFEATVSLRALAAIGENAKVTCEFGGKPVGARAIPVKEGRQTTRLRFEVPTEAKGTYPLVVKVEPLDGEKHLANNVLQTDVRVTSRKVQVLLLEGAMRWEATFLRRSLAGDPGINLVLGYASDPRIAAKLATAEYRQQFDVIILGDVGADRVPKELVRALPELIAKRAGDKERGRGLLMTGGGSTLSAGGWAASPLSRIFPVVLSRTTSRVEGEVPALPTHQGARHFALRFAEDPDRNEQIWESMPPLLGADKPRRIKQNATLLLRSPKAPLLVTAPYGLGRIAVLTTGSTWRWVMSENKELRKRHRTFWRQLVLWLAKRDEEGQGRMWLTLRPGKSLFVRGERADVLVNVIDGRWRPDPAARVDLSLVGPGGKATRLEPAWDKTRNAFVSALDLKAVGDYTLKGAAFRGTDEIGTDTLTLSVRKRAPLETADPFARPEVLARIAGRTRGSTVDLAQAAGLLRSLRDKARSTVHVHEVQEDRWDRSWILILFALALGAEWTLRKMRGMV